MGAPSFSEDIYKKIYPGWGRTEAEADWREQGEKKWSDYQTSLRPSVSSLQVEGPSVADRAAFNERLKGEEQGFLSKFRTEYPEIISGIETTLGLPQLRQSAYDLTETLRNIPRVQEQATRGFDVTANQLARMIQSGQEKVSPLAQEAVREAQFAEETATKRGEQALVPYKAEIELMKDRFAREATGFNVDVEARLNILLTQIQEQGATDRVKLQEATRLAELEQNKEMMQKSFATVDLGNRVALLDLSGNEIGSLPKSKLTSETGNNVQSYFETLTDQNQLQVLQPTPSFRSMDYMG
jgi:hypothetical protein